MYNNNVTCIMSSGKIESQYPSAMDHIATKYRLHQHSEWCFLLLSRKSTPTPLLKLYLTTVLPHLEYASSVWDPHLKKDTEDIEHVQKFALKLWYCSYYNLLTNIPTLAFRRQQLKLFLNCCSPFPDSPAARRASTYLTSIRSISSATLTQPLAHTTLFPFSPL